jgi:hypothetical protein
MYQLANTPGDASPARLFLEAASVTPATSTNLAFVDAFTDSLRVALCADDLEPLRRDVLRAKHSGAEVHDLLAAAEYQLNESLLDLGLPALHDAAARLGSIVRDVRRHFESARAVERRSFPRQAVFA